MDAERIDTIIQYALAVAAKEDDVRDRELGPIHLLKYVYLADVAYADRHAGRTYTGVRWEFYKLGPWCQAVHKRIEPAVTAIGANIRPFDWHDGEKEGEGVRYGVPDSSLIDKLEMELPFPVTSALKRYVHEFTACTPELLHHVYLTRPMLRAAPREILDFTPPEKAEEPRQAEKPSPSAKQRKNKALQMEASRERIRQKLEEKRARRKGRSKLTPTPRYDAVYEKGMKWLDSLAGSELPAEGEAAFSDEIWKSRCRYDPDLP